MGKRLILTIVLIVLIVSGGVLYYFSLPKQVGKVLGYPNLISCNDDDGYNIHIKSRSYYEHTYRDDGEGTIGGSAEDNCDLENLVGGKPALREYICEDLNSYYILTTCGWFNKCVKGRCT